MLRDIIKFCFSVRVRYAPSPTGMMHLGGLRTALYNYLFAKKYDGKFILRIEDTDQKRLVSGSLQNIISTLQWTKLTPDEGPNIPNGNFGPYIQSQRLPIYQKYTAQLLQSKHLYPCFCSQRRLEDIKWKRKHSNLNFYDGSCRSLSQQQVDKKMERKQPYALRFKTPDKAVTFIDRVYGEITIGAGQTDDFIAIKADKWPTYHFASVIDDHEMKITHVIRGQQWLSSTPKHILLYEALQLKPPQFVHLPLLLSSLGGKLSKREKSTSLEFYRQHLYEPQSLVNAVALLGWSPKDGNQMLSLERLVKQFTLEDLNKSEPTFDIKKMDHFNKMYIVQKYQLSSSQDHVKLKMFRDKLGALAINKTDSFVLLFNQLIIRRIKRWSDIDKYYYCFSPPQFDSKKSQEDYSILYSSQVLIGNHRKDSIKNKQYAKNTTILNATLQIVQQNQVLSQSLLSSEIKKFLSCSQGISQDDFYHLLRFCITGRISGPNIIKIILLLEKKDLIQRIRLFI